MVLRYGKLEGIEFRKKMMVAFAKAYRNGKADTDSWVDVDSVRGVTYPRQIIRSLLKLNLVTTKKDGDKLFARITLYGLSAVELNAFTYNSLQKTVQLPKNIHAQLVEIAKDLGITRAAGRGAGTTPSVVGLMEAVAMKPDAFKKWFRAVYPEEK